MGSEQHVQSAIIVTIDGPAGAGKTTISKLLARTLGYRYLDTGALYRAVAVAAMDRGIASEDEAQLASLCGKIEIDLEISESGMLVFLNRTDITSRLRTPDVSMMASAVSAKPAVRAFLLETQRVLGKKKAIVAEGRDMGTVVFPDAEAKFFLDANVQIRAKRRFEELKVKNSTGPSLSTVEKDMIQRDRNDSTRQIAPLQPAPDAVRIDSTLMTPDQVVDFMMDIISEKF